MVNEWIRKSIELANKKDYLDRLYTAYPLMIGEERHLAPSDFAVIQKAYNDKDGTALVKALLNLKRFPIDYPYASLIRLKPDLHDLNPETVQRIAEPMLKMDFNKLLTRCMTPKSANTQMGPLFRKWMRTLRYPVLSNSDFEDAKGVAFLEGSDKDLQIYANQELDCALRKGLDLLFKVDGQFYIGEAKFFGSSGGNQNKSFDEALDFLGAHRGNATRIAVLDGAVWLDNLKQKMQREIRKQDSVALSALLLKDYVESVS